MFSGFNVHPLRTVLINTITIAVASGLLANRRRHPPLAPAPWPRDRLAPYVEIIVPARDEERNISLVLDTLTDQSYPRGSWGVTVVDDHSTDGTRTIAERYAHARPHVRVMAARDLPQGWTGKNNAIYSGFLAAPLHAVYLLFVDADTTVDRHLLSTIVAAAEARDAALMSLVLDVRLETFWQRLLVPQVGEMYALLCGTMDNVNRQGDTAAANGQCMLVSYDAYSRHGASPGVRGDVAEDRALAAAIKRNSGTIRLEHGERLGSVEPYRTFGEAWAGYSKTLYWAAGRDTLRALAVVTALEVYAHLPVWSLVHALLDRGYPHRRSALGNAPLQLIPMLILRLAVCSLMRIPARYALSYPLAVLVGNAMLLNSLVRSRSKQGVKWKGRSYGGRQKIKDKPRRFGRSAGVIPKEESSSV
ncbi:MAG TPA: glycosyltransferase family 2 protein [Chloroflexia bacterium]|nr:glycosyltransferase family 2 protein [Chloroflexia bacterium]